jgi:hypothetical protein
MNLYKIEVTDHATSQRTTRNYYEYGEDQQDALEQYLLREEAISTDIRIVTHASKADLIDASKG